MLAGFFLCATVANWYFYFNPTNHVSEIEPIGLNFKTFIHAFAIVVCVYFMAIVKPLLGKLFWGFLLFGILLQLGWQILLANSPIETYDMVGRIQLTITALVFLFFAILEKFGDESITKQNKKESA